MDNNKNTPAKPKSQGPIRFEFIVPIGIVLALVYGYFFLFFDSHVRRAMEWGGTLVNGAEVNIQEFKTSFFRGTVLVRNIQVTDKSMPARNLVQLREVRLGLLGDALLRAKFVINEAAIEDIQVYSQRSSPGRVLPPAKTGTSPAADLEARLAENIQGRINDTALGDVAAVLGGVDVSEQLKTIQANLKAEAHLNEVNKFVTEKQKEWEQRIAGLPQAKDFNEIAAQARRLKFDGNPIEVAQNVQRADQLIKQADAKVREFSKTKSDLDKDVNNLNNSARDIERFIQEDIKQLQGRLKLPSLDAKDISRDLFLGYVGKYLVQYQKYSVMAQKYLPPKKTDDGSETSIVPRQRAVGESIQFPVRKGYPLFHLKRASITSTGTEGSFAGNAAGEIIDATSHPTYLGRPMLINFNGDFPGVGVTGIEMQAVVDHTTDEPKQSLEASVAAFPVSQLMLSESDDVRFGMESAQGQVDLQGVLKGGEFSLKVLNNFKEIDYTVEAKDKLMSEVLGKVSQDIPIVTVRAELGGTFSNLNVLIDSNFGRELGASLKRQVDGKIREAQAQVRQFVDGRIREERTKVEAQISQVRSQLTAEFDKKKAEADKAKSDLEKQVKGSQKSKGNDPKDKARKLLGL